MSTSSAKRPVVLPADLVKVVREHFGDSEITEVSALGGGLSGSTVFSVTVGGFACVVRKGGAQPRELACMKIAASIGVAPKLLHVDDGLGVVIMEKIDGLPFGLAPSSAPDRLLRLARTLRTLHEGPAFPASIPLPQLFRHLDEQLRAAGAAGVPKSVLAAMDELSIVTARFAGTRPCHGDLNPNNILETADRFYFVDWDTAGAGDPFFDLGALGLYAFPGAPDREQLLENYLGRPPDDESRARATLGRVMALAFYAAAFRYVCFLAGLTVPPTRDAISFPDLLARVRATRERTPPHLFAASLTLEMEREAATPEVDAAKRRLENAR